MCNSNFSYGSNPCNAPVYERITVSDDMTEAFTGCSNSVIDPEFRQNCGCNTASGCNAYRRCSWNNNCCGSCRRCSWTSGSC